MGNCVCSCSFNHSGYETTYDEVTIKEKIIMESPRKLGSNFLGTLRHVPGQRSGGQRGNGKLLLTPGFIHVWLVMTNVYFRLNLADVTNVEFRGKFKGRRPVGRGKIIVMSFKDETGRPNEVGLMCLPSEQQAWMNNLRREIHNAGGYYAAVGRVPGGGGGSSRRGGSGGSGGSGVGAGGGRGTPNVM